MKYEEIISRGNPSQSHWELNELLLDVERISPRIVLEIGVHMGGSLRVWKEAFKTDLAIGVNTTDEMPDKTGFSIVIGDSHAEDTLDTVMHKLNGRMVDFLFIDGDHLYEGVKKDFEMYSPLVRAGGIVGFHDVVLRGNDVCEAYRFWAEVTVGRKSKTIWDGTPSGTGEGVLWL